MKRSLSLLLCAALALSLLAGCGPKGASSSQSSSGSAGGSGSASSEDPSGSSSGQSPSDAPVIDFMALSGPTGVGAAWLMDNYSPDAAPSDAPFVLSASVEADNQVVSNALINGDADIAAMATNVAASLYAKSDGAIQVLCVNTLGVLYLLEKGDSVHSVADLRGKTVYATGQGANPEYILNYLLTQSDVDPSQVDVQWMTAQEVTAKMVSSDSGICMLPVPAATALLAKDDEVRQAVSLSQAWDLLDQGPLPMGCIVATTQFIEENPQLVESFLELYGQSIAYMSDQANLTQGAQLVAELGITDSQEIAQAAIPQCNLTFLTGTEMRSALEPYYQVLFQADPASIGGGMPYDSFYYGAH